MDMWWTVDTIFLLLGKFRDIVDDDAAWEDYTGIPIASISGSKFTHFRLTPISHKRLLVLHTNRHYRVLVKAWLLNNHTS